MEEFIEKLIGRLEEERDSTYFVETANPQNQHWHGVRERDLFDEIIAIVNELAEEHKGGWIPCSERLPDDFMSFEYLTIRKGHTLATITYYCVANKKWYLSRNSTKEIDVIAWQPLPEHYKQKTK